MEVPCRCLLVLLLSVFTGQVLGQENTQTRIPAHLIECYRNQTLRHRENRLPMTIETFIEIIRKVERYQQGTVDMSGLATSLLHAYRQDGIERNQDIQETEGVLPYAVSGKAFFKHRIILKYLVPGNEYRFPNESLTQAEVCTLHFMLSHSIDRIQRGDEYTVCNKVSNYEDLSPNSRRFPRFVRLRRQIENEESEATVEAQGSGEEHNIEEQVTDGALQETTHDDLTSAHEGSGEASEYVTDSNIETTFEPLEISAEQNITNSTAAEDSEVEVIKELDNQTKSGNYIFDDDIQLSQSNRRKDGTDYRSRSQPSKVILPDSATSGPNSIDVSRTLTRSTVNVVESDCPVENGVVRTDWGTISLGTVLSGIAAGLFQQNVQVQDLIIGGSRDKNLPASLATATVDNRYAVTLAGDLAEVALVQGPKISSSIKVGTSGGWNSTIYPRWYFISERENNEMTDAEIRGGIDGLVMATYARTWKEAVSGGGLRLSQLLSMYYSEDGVYDAPYRACQRRSLYSEVTSNLQDQTFRFAIVLDQHALTSASLDDSNVQTFSQESASRLSSYVPGMIDNLCASQQINSSVVPYTNVTIVIDRNWAYKDIKNILYYLMRRLRVEEQGSRVTVIDGRNGVPFLNDSMSTLDLESNFTEAAYNTHDVGMDIPRALEQELLTSMKGVLDNEQRGGGRSKIILFLPRTNPTFNDNDLTIAREKVKYFRDYLPDVHFLYLVPGSNEIYQYLVNSVASDVFTFSYQGNENEIPGIIDPVVNRIKQIPLRLINPNCGSNWQSRTYNNAYFIHHVKPQGVNYHRLQPNYLFGTGSPEVRVVGSTYADLKVCYSRRNENPDNATSTGSDVTCKQIRSDEFLIKLDAPCDGFDYVSQCPPLYISVASVNRVEQYGCTESDCPLPNYVKYTISNRGLGCTAGIGRFLSSPQLVTFAATLILLLRNLFISS